MTNDAIAVPEVGPNEAVSLLEEGAFLLDVREQDEWEAGRAKQAHHLPLGELEARHLEVPRDVTIVCVCRSGARSAMAAAAFISAGYDARNLTGGMHGLHDAGLPLIDAAGAPGVVV